MSELLVAENVHKSYHDGIKELHVVRGVNLAVPEGEMLAITGPSGAGKSTLLHIFGALDAPDTGDMVYDDRRFSSLSGGKLAAVRNNDFGFVFQFFHLLPDLRAIENVMLPAMIGTGRLAWPKNRSEIRDRAEALLEDVGLADRATHKPKTLSGGERQRVAIARALINQPRIVFCDEPTGNLDSVASNEIFELIHRLNSEGNLTLVMVTHNERLAQRADRVLPIIDGQIIEPQSNMDSRADDEPR